MPVAPYYCTLVVKDHWIEYDLSLVRRNQDIVQTQQKLLNLHFCLADAVLLRARVACTRLLATKTSSSKENCNLFALRAER